MEDAPEEPSVLTPSSRWPLGGWGSLDWIRSGLLINLGFWSKPETWPHDPDGYVFLARAVDEIGKAMFGHHWTGKEWTSELTPGMDPSLIARRATVQQEAARLCESGKLVFALRPIAGGEMTIAPPDWWNTEPQRLQCRFYCCQMDANAPFRNVSISANNSWIFIERKSLEKELAQHPFAPAASSEDAHLSPYVRAMLHVIKQLGITAENQYTKKKIEDAILAEWKKPYMHLVPMSKNLYKAMATLVREPGSQKGRAAKNKNLSQPIKEQ
jgi:hypothetical protein